MSEVKVNKISPRSGTTVTLGDSGDTITLASGVSLTGVNATFSGDLTVDTDTLKVDSTNNRVGVGTTSPSVTFDAEADGATVAHFNRETDNGDIVEFQKDGTTVGSIGTSGGDIYIGTADTAIKFGDGLDSIQPWDISINDLRDNAIDLGRSSGRFKDAYLSGSVYLGGTTSANALDDYEEGTWTPSVGRNSTFGTYTPGAFDGGKYTKIGNVVYFSCRVGGTNTTASGGSWVIRGLPFTSANDFTWGRTPYQIIGSDGTPGGLNSGQATVYVDANTNDLRAVTLVSGSTYYASGFYYVS